VGEWLGAFEADELAEVAGDVEVEQRDEDGLPDGELGGEERGDAAEERRAVAVASVGVLAFAAEGVGREGACL
jgi:hypothetical protein